MTRRYTSLKLIYDSFQRLGIWLVGCLGYDSDEMVQALVCHLKNLLKFQYVCQRRIFRKWVVISVEKLWIEAIDNWISYLMNLRSLSLQLIEWGRLTASGTNGPSAFDSVFDNELTDSLLRILEVCLSLSPFLSLCRLPPIPQFHHLHRPVFTLICKSYKTLSPPE